MISFALLSSILLTTATSVVSQANGITSKDILIQTYPYKTSTRALNISNSNKQFDELKLSALNGTKSVNFYVSQTNQTFRSELIDQKMFKLSKYLIFNLIYIRNDVKWQNCVTFLIAKN